MNRQIDVPGLEAIADSVKNDPDQRTVAFRVKTDWKGQARSVTAVSDYMLGGETFSRHFKIRADQPRELLGENTAPNPQELLMAALNACMSAGYAASAATKGIELEKRGNRRPPGPAGLPEARSRSQARLRGDVLFRPHQILALAREARGVASVDQEDVSEIFPIPPQ
jgi:hypothetical protein